MTKLCYFKVTMYLVKSNEKMASDFITQTCQLISKLYSPSSDHMHNIDLLEPKEYTIVCGSRAEFYIRPLNTCIGDIDYLLSKADHLAFSGDFPVLPSDISGLADAIHCYEIEPCLGIPGFVRLRDWGNMKFNWKQKKYKLNRKLNQNVDLRINRTEA